MLLTDCISIKIAAFEICHEGSWLPVKRFRICEGRFLLQIENRDAYELQGREAIQRLRLRPRKALPSDCKHFLKPGVDICVFSKPVSPLPCKFDSMYACARKN